MEVFARGKITVSAFKLLLCSGRCTVLRRERSLVGRVLTARCPCALRAITTPSALT